MRTVILRNSPFILKLAQDGFCFTLACKHTLMQARAHTHTNTESNSGERKGMLLNFVLFSVLSSSISLHSLYSSIY